MLGKVTSIYLSDEEAAELKKFCEENNCTQYAVIKTAMKEMISKRIKNITETKPEQDEVEDEKPKEDSVRKQFLRLLREEGF